MRNIFRRSEKPRKATHVPSGMYGSALLGLVLAPLLGLIPAATRPPDQNVIRAAGKPVEKQNRKQINARKNEPAPAKDIPVPFRMGETLNYRIAWAAFSNAASLQVSVPERRVLFGWPSWHFRASLHTLNPVRNLFAIDDEFDSYTDSSSMESHQYELYLSELGKKTTEVLHFVPSGQTSQAPAPQVVVLPGTRDPIAVLYAIRSVDWQHAAEFHAPVYDGHEIYQLSAAVQAKNDIVSVPAGTFGATRLAVRLTQSTRKVASIDFEVWLANDTARTPVQFQAVLPFGNVRAELEPAPK